MRMVPHVQRLLSDARAHNMLVIHGGGPLPGQYGFNNGPTVPIEQLNVLPGEPWVHSLANKFVNSDLEKLLARRGITDLIVTGNMSQGAVYLTATHAANLGLRAIIPVDGITAAEPFATLATIWFFKHGPGIIVKNSELTRTDLITIH